MRATIAIVGGGAAGLAAGIAAAERARACGADAHVVVFEGDERVGRSILASGNGRCNFSNARIDPSSYNQPEFVARALGALDARLPLHPSTPVAPHPIAAFFSEHGLWWREEAQGRLYPATGKASTVLDVLRASADAAGVDFRFERRLTAVQQTGERRFMLRFADGSIEHADAVVLATGGRATSPELAPEALDWISQSFVLGPLKTRGKEPKSLDGVRVRCGVEVRDGSTGHALMREEGELLFRAYGVSGVVVFNASRFARSGDAVVIDFVPSLAPVELKERLVERRNMLAQRGMGSSCEALLTGMLLPSVMQAVLSRAGITFSAPCSDDVLECIVSALKGFSLEVVGIGDSRQCQVTSGGFSVGSFSPETLESIAVPGFYVVGEALDVDAPCGGFNLHWAFATGLLAGASAVEALYDCEGGALA